MKIGVVAAMLCFSLTRAVGSDTGRRQIKTPSSQPPAGTRQAQTTPESIVTNAKVFLDRVEALGFELPYRPEMREWTRSSLISWREEARAVAIPHWEDIPPDVRGQLAQWSSTDTARDLFEWSFRWFLPLHELAHFLQTEFGAAENHSADERLANDLAAAFWRTQPNGIECLEVFRRLVEQAVAASPDPTPPGNDPRHYFDANYDELVRNPRRYGAYQWRFILESLRRTDQLDFDSLVCSILRKGGIPSAVALDPDLDVGFHVAAHLDLPDVTISVFDPQYVAQAAQARKELDVADDMLATTAKQLSVRLNRHWHVHQLVRVPALFPNFRDTRTALGLLLGDITPSPGNQAVQKRLDSFLSLYPYLKTLSDPEMSLARELAALIRQEFDGFYPRFHQMNRQDWEPTRRRFRDAWRKEIAPAMALLNADHQIREIVVVLSPALRRHGKSYRVSEGIGRVAALLPQEPEELEHALLYAFHEMCHGVSDMLVYEAKPGMTQQDLSYKYGERGKALHTLIEAAADQAMFEALGRTNPKLQERFLSGFGKLNWLAKNSLLQEQTALAGHKLSKRELGRLQRALEENPTETSRIIYRRGLRVPKRTLQSLRNI